ncbi:MAG: hypothetical protein ACLU6O_07880 [Bilophila wadsworthia]
MKIELFPAENHGGPAGRFRVRLDRRWYDLDDRKLFLCPDEVVALAAEFAAGGEIAPVAMPDLPVKARVKVPRGVPGASPVWTGYVASAPIRAADGLWYVAVMLYGGVELHPVDNLVRC